MTSDTGASPARGESYNNDNNNNSNNNNTGSKNNSNETRFLQLVGWSAGVVLALIRQWIHPVVPVWLQGIMTSFYDFLCGCVSETMETGSIVDNGGSETDKININNNKKHNNGLDGDDSPVVVVRSRGLLLDSRKMSGRGGEAPTSNEDDTTSRNDNSSSLAPSSWIKPISMDCLRIPMPTKEAAMTIFDVLDGNGNDTLSFGDLIILMERLWPNKDEMLRYPPTVMKAYHAADANADGFVVRTELEAFLRYYLYHDYFYMAFSVDNGEEHAAALTYQQFAVIAVENLCIADSTCVDHVLNAMDSNRSGSVSYEEYCSWMARHSSVWFDVLVRDEPMMTAVHPKPTELQSPPKQALQPTQLSPLVHVPALPRIPTEESAMQVFRELDVNQNHTLSFVELGQAQKILLRNEPPLTHETSTMKAYHAVVAGNGLVMETEYEAFIRYCVYYDYFYDKFATSGQQHVNAISWDEFIPIAASLHVVDSQGAWKAVMMTRKQPSIQERLSYDAFITWMARSTCSWSSSINKACITMHASPIKSSNSSSRIAPKMAPVSTPTTRNTTTTTSAMISPQIAADTNRTTAVVIPNDAIPTEIVSEKSFALLPKNDGEPTGVATPPSCTALAVEQPLVVDEERGGRKEYIAADDDVVVAVTESGVVVEEQISLQSSPLLDQSEKVIKDDGTTVLVESGIVVEENVSSPMLEEPETTVPAESSVIVEEKTLPQSSPLLDRSENVVNGDKTTVPAESGVVVEEKVSSPLLEEPETTVPAESSVIVEETISSQSSLLLKQSENVVEDDETPVQAVSVDEMISSQSSPLLVQPEKAGEEDEMSVPAFVASESSLPTSTLAADHNDVPEATTATISAADTPLYVEEAIDIFDPSRNVMSSAVTGQLAMPEAADDDKADTNTSVGMRSLPFSEVEGWRQAPPLAPSGPAIDVDTVTGLESVHPTIDRAILEPTVHVLQQPMSDDRTGASEDEDKSVAHDASARELEELASSSTAVLSLSDNHATEPAGTQLTAPEQAPVDSALESEDNEMEPAALERMAADQQQELAANTVELGPDAPILDVDTGPVLEHMLSKEDALRLFNTYDTKRSGHLTFSEVSAMWIFLFPHVQHKPSLMKAFKAADINADSLLNRKELEVFLRFVLFYSQAYALFESKSSSTTSTMSMSHEDFRQAAHRLQIQNANAAIAVMDSPLPMQQQPKRYVTIDEYSTWMARNTMRWDHDSASKEDRNAAGVERAPQADLTRSAASAAFSEMPSREDAMAIFDKYDVNENDILSFAELTEVCQVLFPNLEHKPVIMKAYRAADANADGFVVRSEFESFLRYILYHDQYFDAFSKGDGHAQFMNRDQFIQAAARLNVGDPNVAYDQMDTNKNDLVSYEEYCSWTARHTCQWNLCGGSEDLAPEVDVQVQGYSQPSDQNQARTGISKTEPQCSLTGEWPLSVKIQAHLDNPENPEKMAESIEANDPELMAITARPDGHFFVADVLSASDVENTINDGEWGEYNQETPSVDVILAVVPLISPPHLAKLPSQEQAMSLFDQYDVNQNNTLSFGELSEIWTLLFHDLEHKPAVMKGYRAADKNADGFVVRSEFEAFLRYFLYYDLFYDAFHLDSGEHCSAMSRDKFLDAAPRLHVNDPAKAFDLLDENGNGRVSYEEFCSWMARHSCQWSLDGDVNGSNDVASALVHCSCMHANPTEELPTVERVKSGPTDNTVHSSSDGTSRSIVALSAPFANYVEDPANFEQFALQAFADVEASNAETERSAPSAEQVGQRDLALTLSEESVEVVDVPFSDKSQEQEMSGEGEVSIFLNGKYDSDATAIPDTYYSKESRDVGEGARDETIAMVPASVFTNMPAKERALDLFDQYDVNQSNALSFGELSEILKILFTEMEHKPNVMRAYKPADENSDGFVTRAEFEAFLRYILCHGNFYDAFNVDGEAHANGLNREQVEIAGSRLNVKDAAKSFDLMDKKKSGVVCYEEFCSWMARNTCQWSVTSRDSTSSPVDGGEASPTSNNASLFETSALVPDEGYAAEAIHPDGARDDPEFSGSVGFSAKEHIGTQLVDPGESLCDADCLEAIVDTSKPQNVPVTDAPENLADLEENSGSSEEAADSAAEIATSNASDAGSFNGLSPLTEALVTGEPEEVRTIAQNLTTGSNPILLMPAVVKLPTKKAALDLFDKFDENKSNTLSQAELAKVWNILLKDVDHRPTVMKACHAADANLDGFVAKKEFEVFVRFVFYHNCFYDGFTVDGKHHVNVLGRDNFLNAAPKLNVKDPVKAFDLMDANGNGAVSYEEFCSWMARNTCIWNL